MFELFESVVKDTAWVNANELKDNLKKLCEMLISKDKMNFVCRNCSERMLRLMNQACKHLKISTDSQNEVSTLTSLKDLKRIIKDEEEGKLDLESPDLQLSL
jgi:translation initiation factor 2B subunit (eIF-2B alpha/beta/delta family)